MRIENAARCMARLNCVLWITSPRLPRNVDGDLVDGISDTYMDVLLEMEDEAGVKAVEEVVRNCKFPPKPSDICEVYARIIGCASGETPEEAIARHERQRQMTEQWESDFRDRRRREREEYEAIHGPLDLEKCKDMLDRWSRGEYMVRLPARDPAAVPESDRSANGVEQNRHDADYGEDDDGYND